MKKLVKNSKQPIHLELEIIAVISKEADEPIAAAKHIIDLEYRDLPVEYQLTPAELSTYRSFLMSMASIIVSSGFEIVEEYQSAESYSYYIQFTPVLYDGILDNFKDTIPMKVGTDTLLDVKFRLSNHYVAGKPIVPTSIARSISSGSMFKEFVVAGVRHSSINAAIKDLQEICEELKLGNYGRLLKPSEY